MKKLITAAVMALALSGCAGLKNIQDAYTTLTSTQVTPRQVYILANSFDAAQDTATQYLRLPLCVSGGPAVCRTKAATATLKITLPAARTIRNNLEAAVTANDMVQATSLYNALSTNLTTINTIVKGAS